VSRAASATFDARRIVQWGVLWGLTVVVAESLVVSRGPNASAYVAALPWIVFYLAPVWCIIGCFLTVCASRAEAAWGPRGVVAAWLVAALAAAAAYIGVSASAWNALASWNAHARTPLLPGAERWLATPLVAEDLFAYNAWTTLFFGAFLCAAVALEQRSERTRALLYSAQLGRERTAALIGRVQLDSFRSQVDPRVVSDTLAEIRELYHRDPPAAEALLDAMVAFLRAAMAGRRDRNSTLGAELMLARCYAELQSARGQRHAWRIASVPAAAAAERPFPTQVVLRLLACAADGADPTADVETDTAGGIRLVFRGLGDVPADLAQDVALRLRAVDPRSAFACRSDVTPAECIIELPT
jgi:hypothetical protein